MLSRFALVSLVLVVLVGLLLGVAGVAEAGGPKGAPHGNGRPPEHAKTGGRSGKTNNDPDDDGRGPDRGDGTIDDEDHNNGCGNDEDRADDNEGWCGKPHRAPVIPPPEKKLPIVIQPKVCKLVLYGWTPEVFASGVDVHNPDNEKYVLAEAHYYLELVLPMGFYGTILWYQPGTGHGSLAQGFVCDGEEVVIYEPFDNNDDWIE